MKALKTKKKIGEWKKALCKKKNLNAHFFKSDSRSFQVEALLHPFKQYFFLFQVRFK